MNDVERFLDRACCGVGGSHELRRHLRKELHGHLASEIERNVATGMAQEEAVQKAIEEFGDPVMIRDGLQTVHGRRLLTLLIEKSMIWKEKTMKTGWKWSFVAHVALVLTIALEVYFLTAARMYIFPLIFGLHHDLGTPTFAYIDALPRFCHWLYLEFVWIPCLLSVLAGWGVFEWKYHSENKSIVRLASLSLLSFVMFLSMAIICVPMTIDLAMLPRQIYDSQMNLTPQQAERIVLPKISEADVAFKELGEAIDREDWPAVDLSADLLSDTCESLHETSVSIMLLAGESQRNNLAEIRDFLDEIEKTSYKIHSRYTTYKYSKNESKDDLRLKTLAYFEQLKESFQALGTKSDLFAAARNPEALQE
jgi:hypothetical protein